MLIARHLRIRGRVQGVGFRYALQNEAQRLALAGWVRNRHDGSVEAVIHGPQEAVETMIEWAQHGPPAARVTDVEVNADDGSYSTFEVRPTG